MQINPEIKMTINPGDLVVQVADQGMTTLSAGIAAGRQGRHVLVWRPDYSCISTVSPSLLVRIREATATEIRQAMQSTQNFIDVRSAANKKRAANPKKDEALIRTELAYAQLRAAHNWRMGVDISIARGRRLSTRTNTFATRLSRKAAGSWAARIVTTAESNWQSGIVKHTGRVHPPFEDGTSVEFTDNDGLSCVGVTFKHGESEIDGSICYRIAAMTRREQFSRYTYQIAAVGTMSTKAIRRVRSRWAESVVGLYLDDIIEAREAEGAENTKEA